MVAPKPVEFVGQNGVLGPPKGMTDEECGSLPILQNGDTIVSCWKIPFWQRIKLLWTGVVWLGVLSRGMPPVWIVVDNPVTVEAE